MGIVSSLEQHPHWKTVEQIQQKLVHNGYRSLIAGGAVRDLLLGRPAHDIDIATSATPDEVARLFNKVLMVGKEFGVCRVVIDEVSIEVATFRKDGPYSDGRKPDSIIYSSEQEDAFRRDFTINALFYDPQTKKVLDYVGGEEDLKKGLIRAVGDASLRFTEDKLRILRAVRFYGQLNFSIEVQTEQAIAEKVKDIHQISIERIRDEWDKILVAPFGYKSIEKAWQTGLWSELFPLWHYEEVFIEQKLFNSPSNLLNRWCLFLLSQDWQSRESLQNWMKSWKFSNDPMKTILFCYGSLSELSQPTSEDPLDLALFCGEKDSALALSVYRILRGESVDKAWEERITQAQSYLVNGQLPSPLVNGTDLIQHGIKPGPSMADHLKRLYKIQLREKILKKEELIKKI